MNCKTRISNFHIPNGLYNIKMSVSSRNRTFIPSNVTIEETTNMNGVRFHWNISNKRQFETIQLIAVNLKSNSWFKSLCTGFIVVVKSIFVVSHSIEWEHIRLIKPEWKQNRSHSHFQQIRRDIFILYVFVFSILLVMFFKLKQQSVVATSYNENAYFVC